MGGIEIGKMRRGVIGFGRSVVGWWRAPWRTVRGAIIAACLRLHFRVGTFCGV